MNLLCFWSVALCAVVAAPAVVGAPRADGVVTVEFTPAQVPGKYSPRNVLAVWVADAQTNYVRTLEVRGAKRRRFLEAWNAARGGDAPVDGVTGATLGTNAPRRVLWDCRDRRGELMPDGSYVLCLEVTSRNGPGPVVALPFRKEPGAKPVQSGAQAGCAGVRIVFEPAPGGRGRGG